MERFLCGMSPRGRRSLRSMEDLMKTLLVGAILLAGVAGVEALLRVGARWLSN